MSTKTNWALALMVMFAFAACSQSESGNPASAATTANQSGLTGPGQGRVFAQLGLTEDQQTKVRAIFESHRSEREALRQARREGASQADLETRRSGLQAKVHEELAAVLTAAQMQQLDQWHAQRMQRGFGPMSDSAWSARVDRRLERLTTQLDLSSTQQAEIRELWKGKRAEVAGRQPGDRPGKEEMQARRQAVEAEMKNILNAEQLAKWQDLHARGPAGRQRHGQVDN